MEKRDLYDKNRKLTGETIYKGEEIPDGKKYLEMHIMLKWM